ncbi:MAG: hypothetical protein PHY16_12140 [Methylobacter sp.]|nr:hypothetical protein [Methylobacter sp.]
MKALILFLLAVHTVWVALGRVRELPVDAKGNADIPISASPVYVLSQVDYKRLMGI